MNRNRDDREDSMKNSFVSLAVLLITASGLRAQEPAPAATPAPAPPTIDAVLGRPALWETTAADLDNDLKTLRFEWTSAAQDTARSATKGLTFNHRPLSEVLLRFQGGKLSEATLNYFNRGDAGNMSEHEFDKLLEGVSADLTTLTGKAAVDRGRDASGAVRAEGRQWSTNGSDYLLEWSISKAQRVDGVRTTPRPEFIRLTVRPQNTTQRAIGATTPTNTSRMAVKQFVGRDHVEKQTDGTVWLKDVPMVDQGDKGYCVVATAERILRYYGVEVDQHELAQMANSDAQNGTTAEAMMTSMKKLTTRFGIKSKSLVDFDLAKLITDYNRATRGGKVAPEVGMNYRSVDDYYERMKPELLKEVRVKKTADFGKFQREIQRSVDEGIPLMWSVRMGLIEEKKIPLTPGGHMRMIIGYNTATKEIIYSDSWGMGHEQKRMPFDNAWTMTTGLYSLQPVGS